MDGDKKKVIEEKINKIVKKAEGITGLPTDFRLETNEGSFIFDEKTGEFVKSNSQWMADNPRRWMADLSSSSEGMQGGEGFVMGVIATPDGADVYSQKFEGGNLIKEDKDIFSGERMIENSSSGEKIKVITDKEIEEEGSKHSRQESKEDNQEEIENFTTHHQILPKK